jgi:hypothetical protein
MNRTTLKAQSEWIAKRKAELGLTGKDYGSANPGGRRTPEKQVMLRKLEALRAGNPRALGFRAKI